MLVFLLVPPLNIAISPAQDGRSKIKEGGTLPLVCTVEANPPASFSWSRGDRVLIQRSYSGVLNLTSVSKWDSDTYNCTATNIYGSVTGHIYVDVLCKYQYIILHFFI